MTWAWTLAITSVVVYLTASLTKYRRTLARVHHLPGMRILLDPFTAIGHLLPQVRGINISSSFHWKTKHSVFQAYGQDVYSLVGFFASNWGYHVSDLNAIKQITAARSDFTKATADYDDLRIFGENVLVLEGEEWKRHRRICAPAFSDRNNRLVWETTTRLADGLMMEWSKDEPTRMRDTCRDVTKPFSLCVIANAGFGQDVKWRDHEIPALGHQMAFKKALFTVAENIIITLVMPDWAWCLREKWRYAKLAFGEVKLYLHEMIDQRRDSDYTPSDLVEKHDLFSQLLNAHDAGDRLTADELIGNIFIFLIAGHETSAHASAFLFGLMALYPDEQEKLVKHIKEAESESDDLSYDSLRKIPYLMAVIYETLRLFPVALSIPKHASTDTELKFGSTPDTTQTIGVPAGTRVQIHIPGVHYNPKYWDDPFEFNPSRFLDPNWNRDAFVSFSVGPRACIGRRFAETTIAALVVRLLPQYRISVDETIFKPIPGESMIDRRDRLMDAKGLMLLAPTKLPLVFTPRG